MIPSAAGIVVLLGWFAFGVVASFFPAWEGAWAGTGIALLGIALLDAGLAGSAKVPNVERTVASALSVGVPTRVGLSVENRGRMRSKIRLFDHHPPHSRPSGLPIALDIPAKQRAECSYELVPLERGDLAFDRAELRIASPLRLFERSVRAGEALRLRAYPNFRAAVGYELLAAENRAGSLGIRRLRRRGEGLEFHQLREYRDGDMLRQIDWKATARLGKTISREYQDERDQQIVFLLDCGRRLHTRDGDQSHFDAALDAILLASHVALRQGDAVGLLTFAGERRWLAPRKGVGQVNALLNQIYDLKTSPRAADYTSAARDLVTRVRKRALVVLVSNVRDEDAGELRTSLQLLSRHHLVLLASLHETSLSAALETPIHDLSDALRTASVRLYLEQRRDALRMLERSGALLLDTEPSKLPVALVNRYLEVKASGVL